MTRSLGAVLDAAVETFGDRQLLVGPATGEQTYQEFAQRVNGAAHGLRALGVRPGDVVATVLPNSAELLLVWLATARLGAVLVPLNPALSDHEISPLLAHSGAGIVVADRAGRDWPAGPRLLPVVPAQDGPCLTELAEPATQPPAVRVDPADPVTVLYTSGTTGAPKGCTLSHASYTMPATGFVARIGLRPDDRLLACLPLFHMGGQSFAVSALAAGAALGIVPKFSAHGFWNQVENTRATVFRHLGEMLKHILRVSPAVVSGHSLRLAYGGGARSDVAASFTRRFGVTVVEGYGLSETNTVLCGDPARPKPGSMGRALPHVHVRVAAPVGEVGELQVGTNPALMSGYHRDPVRTAKAISDGWFHTGDLATVDHDGWFYFVSRRCDIIRRRGENIDPAEIEEAIGAHPDVELCAVVGVAACDADGTGDEDIVAFVVPAAAASVSETVLGDWCRSRLAPFKVPQRFNVVGALPMTATAKINRSLLRAEERREGTRNGEHSSSA